MKATPAVLFLFLTSLPCVANQAVSELNGKLGAAGGSMNSQDAGMVEASITWPVGDGYGFQLDGLYARVGQEPFGFARVEDVDFGGLAAHFFLRDGAAGMVGLETGTLFSESADSFELAIEAERYFDWFTIGAKAGVAWIDLGSPFQNIDPENDAWFGQLYLGVYPVDNLVITAFLENRFDNTSGGLEIECGLPVTGLTLFANAMTGRHGYDQAFFGMRYYFGEARPLRNRHRESDPANPLPRILSGIGSYSAEALQGTAAGGGSGIGGSGSIGGGGGTVTIGPGHSPGGVGLPGDLILNPGTGLGLPGGGTTIVFPDFGMD